VYAHDLTPRGAHVDNTHAFFNGSRVFLQVIGLEHRPCRLEIVLPAGEQYQSWRIATSMPLLEAASNNAAYYLTQDYHDLIDHPVQMGEFSTTTFQVEGIPHELIILGKHQGDIERLCADLSRLCAYHIQFFASPAPFIHYVFLLTVLGEGYGGLEHQSSCALHCRRDNLPKLGDPGISEGYRTLLGLFSHEYFHAWNIKRIKPEAFTPYHLDRENYTRQLWIFEGITSYYDELALVRTKIISLESYLELLGQTMTSVSLTPGRFKQTLEQSSFEAWTKFYKPDENSSNATVSYYTKGALVALALDLLLRRETAQRCSLDTVMQILWQRYGLTNLGLPEESFESLVAELSGCNLKSFFDQALRSTIDIELAPLLDSVGIELLLAPAKNLDETGGQKTTDTLKKLEKPEKSVLEVKLKSSGSDAQLAYVIEGSAAQKAGLSPHDVIIAVNGLKVDRLKLESMIANYAIGEEVLIHAFRRDELMTFKVKLTGPTLKTASLSRLASISAEQKSNLEAWLEATLES
jgi:predicted metalloprotease with PDZ domain